MTSALDALLSLIEPVVSALLNPSTFLYDPSKRVFWPYLLASVVIAGVALAAHDRKHWWRGLYEKLLSPKLWLHPSSLLDMKLMASKSVIRALLFAPWIASAYGIALGVVRLSTTQFGPAHETGLGATEITLIYTVVLFVCSDFSRYALHRLCHEVPFLWQFHQVHHSAEVMTPLTLYRSHPVENLLFVLRGVVVTGLVTGVFFYHFGTQAVQYQLLGVNVFGLLFNIFGANLRHSQVWLSFGATVERVILSPAQHQIHHSDDPKHFGSNYGSCLALWDRMGGSFHAAQGQEGVRFGLSQDESNHDPHRLGSALVGPFKACWELASTRLRLKKPVEAQPTSQHAEVVYLETLTGAQASQTMIEREPSEEQHAS